MVEVESLANVRGVRGGLGKECNAMDSKYFGDNVLGGLSIIWCSSNACSLGNVKTPQPTETYKVHCEPPNSLEQATDD